MDRKSSMFFVTGVCGVGKTSIYPYLRRELRTYMVYDFDEIAVPSRPSIDWRIATTEYWVDVCIENHALGRKTILLGMTVPHEVIPFLPKSLWKELRYLLLDISWEERIRRLRCRNETRDFILNEKKNWENLRIWLERSVFQFDVVDTNDLTIKEIAQRVVSWVRRN